MEHKHKLKIGDFVLMAVILLTALLLFILPFFAKKSARAEIVIANEDDVRVISLDNDTTFSINSQGITLTVTVEDGKIFVSDSDCRDAICKNTPPISRAGQSIVCVPAGVVIRVVGEEAAVDGISG